jgi:hypothetical protein
MSDEFVMPIDVKFMAPAPRRRIKIICGKIHLWQRSIAELGQDEPAKQAAGPPGEPLMHSDDRPIILLNLLLPQRQRSDGAYVEPSIAVRYPI